MQALSPNYRDDPSDGLKPEIKAYLDEMYLKSLTNLDKTNPKLLVVFSGGNAMGKSTISHKISERFGGLVLENDAVKRQLLKLIPDIDRATLNKTTWQYTMSLYEQLSDITQNGLVVRDGLIDWYYDRILPVFENAGYALFIIGFDVTQQKALELIKKRGNTATVQEERFYVILKDHEIHIKRFRALYTPDVILHDENLFQQDLVLNALGEKLRKLGY
jgi:predicted kinase